MFVNFRPNFIIKLIESLCKHRSHMQTPWDFSCVDVGREDKHPNFRRESGSIFCVLFESRAKAFNDEVFNENYPKMFRPRLNLNLLPQQPKLFYSLGLMRPLICV